MKKKQLVATIQLAMRITIVQVTLAFVFTSSLYAGKTSGQEILDKKISISVDNMEISKVLLKVQAQTGVSFLYSPNTIQADRKISFSMVDKKLGAFINEVIRPLSIDYKIVQDQILLFPAKSNAQTVVDTSTQAAIQNLQITTLTPADNIVSGTVTDENGAPLVGASVVVKSRSLIATTTDNSGNFKLDIGGPSAILVISYIGFRSREISVTANQSVSIKLAAAENSLSTVVVTGYSRQSKRDVTGAVSTISADAIAQTPVTDIGTVLQGRVAGVSVDDQGGPGNTATVRIRGVGTLGDNDPLYVIDGVQMRGGSNLVNTNDIESITILKDPSTTALYGASGGNGVIVITTKSGKIGTPKLEYSTYLGSEMTIKIPAIMSPQQYADAYWGYLKNSGLPLTSSLYGSGPSPVLPYYIIESNQFANNPKGVPAGDPAADPSLYDLTSTSVNYRISKANQQGTDWFKQVFKSAFTQSHQLTLSGATDKSNYALTLNYTDDKGTLLYTYFKRYSLRTNTEFKIKPWLRVGENVLFSYTESNGLGNNHSSGNEISNLYQVSPLLPVYDIKGNLTGTKFGGGTDGIGSLVGGNPIYSRQSSLNGSGFSAGIIGSTYLEVEPVKKLIFQTKIGVQFLPYSSHFFTDSSSAERYAQTTNSFNESSGFATDWRWTNKISYETTIKGIHKISAFIAYEAHGYATRYSSGNTLSLPYTVSSYQYLSNGVSTTGPTVIVGGGGDKYTSASAFGNVNYSLLDKYLASFVLRRDGSSKFGPDKLYGTFPGGSVGWRISKEKFMDNISWLNDLKFRGSYGTVGNDAIGSGLYEAQFGQNSYVTNYALNGSNVSSMAGFALLQLGNPNVQWEVNRTTNVGFDASLFNSAFTASVSWFNRITDKLLYTPPSTQTAGAALPPIENVMKFSNKGIELELGYNSAKKRAFSYDMNFNFSTYRNKVLYINGSPGDSTIGIEGSSFSPGNHFVLTRSVVGREVSAFYGYVQEGIFQSAADYTKYGVTEPGITSADAAPGHFKFKDISGPNGKPDGKIDANDQTFIGDPIPKFTYGFNLNLYYKNFDLGIFLQGVSGNKIFNYWRASSEWPGALGVGSLDTWSTSNTGAKLPIWSNNTNTLDNAPSSFFIESGSYMRIKTMQLGYTFPKINGLSRLRVYVQGFNLFTITNYSGIDPEVNSGDPHDIGVDFGGTYPVARKILFGINLGL